MTKSILFPIPILSAPAARDEMGAAAFTAVMERGLQEAKADDSRPASEVFSNLQRGIQ